MATRSRLAPGFRRVSPEAAQIVGRHGVIRAESERGLKLGMAAARSPFWASAMPRLLWPRRFWLETGELLELLDRGVTCPAPGRPGPIGCKQPHSQV